MFTFFIGSDLYTEDPDGSKHKIEEVMCTNNLRHIKQALFMSLIFFKKIKNTENDQKGGRSKTKCMGSN
jgi:hypothetical protein